jgi:hypothetical protein
MNRKFTAVVTAVLVTGLVLSGCTSEPKSSAQSQGQAQTEQAFGQQSQAVPYPAEQLKDSLERRNIRERLLRTNNPNKIGYVYLLSFSKPLGYYVIKGKVSSTQSQMTTDTFVERHADSGGGNFVYNAPGDDGSYGVNEDGVFFFTTEGAMVTTTLDFVYSDQPIPFNVPKLNKVA